MDRTSSLRPRPGRSAGWGPLLLLAGVSLVLPACSSDGHFSLFGYSTASNFDTRYKTIRVPLFENRTYYTRLEYQLTQMVIQQIEAKSPYKVVQSGDADLELTGRIVSYIKNVLLENPNNEQRVSSTVMTVEVVLKDLHTGEILSKPPKRPGGPLALETVPGANEPPDLLPGGIAPPSGFVPFPNMPAPPAPPNQQAVMNDNPPPEGSGPPPPLPPPPPPSIRPFGPGIVIRSTATFIPELGQSITTAEQQADYSIAVQIVNMLEKPW